MAVKACASLAPQFNGAGNGKRSQAYQAYLQCLGDNGLTVPSTVAGGPRPTIDTTDPSYAAANAKCKVLLPNPGAGGGGSTTTTPTHPAAGDVPAGSIPGA